MYEGGVRVPSLIEWPSQISAGSQTDYPAVTSDYLPTISEVLNVELPDQRPVDGVSLLPVFRGARRERPNPIGFEFRHKLALTDNRYKIIKYDLPPRATGEEVEATSAEFELYDLLADPAERNNLSAEHPEIVKAMAASLQKWRASCRSSAAGNDYR